MHRYAIEWTRRHEPEPKSPDWYWVVGIVATAGIIIAFLFENLLLATIVGLGAVLLMLLSRTGPQEVSCRVDHQDFLVNDTVYPLHDMEAYHIDHKHGELVLRFRTNDILMPVVVVHIPEEYLEEIDLLMRSVVPRERVDETMTHRVLEIFGI